MNAESTKQIFDDLKAYRQKHFQVTSRTAKSWYDSEVVLEITSNGTQWQSIGLMKEEIPAVIAELQKHL